jgi:hypothetical protein
VSILKTTTTIIALILFLLLATEVHSQNNLIDAVHLKNGIVLKGIILEQKINDHITFKTPDGTIFDINYSEIVNIERLDGDDTPINTNYQVSKNPKDTTSNIIYKGPKYFNIFIGFAFPTGDFASTTSSNGGGALTGFNFGFQYLHTGSNISPTAYFSVANNNIDKTALNASFSSLGINFNNLETGSYTSIWGLGGIKFLSDLSPTSKGYFNFLLGFFYGDMPDIKGDILSSGNTFHYTEESNYALAFAYGINFGFIFNRFNAGLSFLGADPEYEVTETIKNNNAQVTASTKQKIPSRIFSFNFGYMF